MSPKSIATQTRTVRFAWMACVLAMFSVRLAAAELPLKAGDRFEIKIGGIPAADASQISGTYTVSDEGTIPVQHLGEVNVTGLKPSELQRRLVARYIDAQLYKDPTVVIKMDGNDPGRVVTVVSGVRRPGAVPFHDGMTLLEAIGACQGFTEFARPEKTKLLRQTDGQDATTIHNLKIGDKAAQDLPLLPGDKVIVPER